MHELENEKNEYQTGNKTPWTFPGKLNCSD